MNKYYCILSIVFQFFIHISFQSAKNNWGWHAHELICEKAIFTLPESLLPLYKKNISFLLENVNAPDRRRFISEMEGFRHYIDLDASAFFPQYLTEAAAFFVPIICITEGGDSLLFSGQSTISHRKKDYFFKSKGIKKIFDRDSIIIADSIFHPFLQNNILKNLENKEFSVSVDSFWEMCEKEHFSRNKAKTKIKELIAHDFLSKKGLLPYHLVQLQQQLSNAFAKKDEYKILKLSAEIAHYLADACVPLHTTKNYNGQLTNQTGIHAFWETRLPELFAKNEYDFFVGKATYIEQPRVYIWDLIKKSHEYVPILLQTEKNISAKIPEEQRFCFEKRGNSVVKVACEAWARAYHEALDGMVEACMQRAILALGSLWYSAWVEAGQPNVNKLVINTPLSNFQKNDTLPRQGTMKGREE